MKFFNVCMALFYKLHLAVDENPKWFPNHQILNTKLVNLKLIQFYIDWFNGQHLSSFTIPK